MNVRINETDVVECATLADASRAVCAERDRAGVGSREWYGWMRSGKGAAVRDGGKIRAYVSYNGRVWLPDGTEVVDARPEGISIVRAQSLVREG